MERFTQQKAKTWFNSLSDEGERREGEGCAFVFVAENGGKFSNCVLLFYTDIFLLSWFVSFGLIVNVKNHRGSSTCIKEMTTLQNFKEMKTELEKPQGEHLNERKYDKFPIRLISRK